MAAVFSRLGTPEPIQGKRSAKDVVVVARDLWVVGPLDSREPIELLRVPRRLRLVEIRGVAEPEYQHRSERFGTDPASSRWL
jgi:hypothetical protein